MKRRSDAYDYPGAELEDSGSGATGGASESDRVGSPVPRRRRCCGCAPCVCFLLVAVPLFLIVAVVIVGVVYGCLAANTVKNTNFNIAGMQVENFEADPDALTWAADIRLWINSNTSSVPGAVVKISNLHVRVDFDSVTVGPGNFGPVTWSPGKTDKFSGLIEAQDQKLTMTNPVVKFVTGTRVVVTAELERITVWGFNVKLPRSVRILQRSYKNDHPVSIPNISSLIS
eukprot:m51a1_g1687 hypothetical protein (229) ;mRNA; r:455550-456412